MRLARINTCMLIVIIGINAYIVTAPFLPIMTLWANKHSDHGHRQSQLTAQLHTSTPSIKPIAAPPVNRLVIPSMLLDTPINEGPDARALRNGPWHRPRSSTPDKGGNTVIAAHRFTYTQPKGTFYHLDVVKPGDEIGVFWQGNQYVYTVQEVKTVPATANDIEAPTKDSRLTLYTCTPLWSPTNRLVVVATKENP